MENAWKNHGISFSEMAGNPVSELKNEDAYIMKRASDWYIMVFITIRRLINLAIPIAH